MIRSRRHGQRLVVHHQVKQLVVVFHKHSLYAEANEDCQFPGEGRIIGTHRGYGTGKNGRMPILMLESLTVQCGATRRASQQKAASHHIGRRPDHVAHTLEAKHRVEDVERDSGYCEGGVSGTRGNERGDRARLADTLLQNLSVDGLPIAIQRLCINRRITLTVGRVNTRHLEQCVHTKGTRFIRHNRHNKLTHFRIFQQFGQQAHHGSGGRQAA